MFSTRKRYLQCHRAIHRLVFVFIASLFIPFILCAEEAETLFGGMAPSSWDTGRDADRLKREFSVSETILHTNPLALEWHFVPRNVQFNDLFLHHPVARDFTRIRLRLQNKGTSCVVAAKTRDASGAEWSTPRVPLLTSNDFQWIEFPRNEWRVASWSRDADGRLDFPLEYVTLIAFDIKTGQDYRLIIDRVEVIRPDPPVLTLNEFRAPKQIDAGQTMAITMEFSLDRAGLSDEAQLIFRNASNDLLRLPLALPTLPSKLAAGQKLRLQNMEIPIPTFTAGGNFTIVPDIGGAKLAAGSSIPAITVLPRTPGKTTARVKQYGGTPTLYINGKPHNGMVWATYSPTMQVFRDFTEAGVNLFTFCGTPTESGYGLSKTTWIAPDQFDYSQFDQRVMMLLSVNPKAYFFPRLYLHAPKWWSEAHPDDVVLSDPGNGRLQPFIHSGGKPAPSWASEPWRRDTAAALRRFIAHVESSPYADRVIGYHLASGTTEEWMMWGGNENEWVDYSPANENRFRRWLKSKYKTVASLRAAWHDENISFDTAPLPSKIKRQQTTLGSFRDPAQEQPVIDFYLYNSDLVAETINYFASAVKEATHRDKIVGVFYGYLLQLCGEQRQQNAGHLALARVLASPDIDFLCSPTSYAFRQLGGEGTAHFMSLFDSVKLQGKLWFNENDVRTSLSGGSIGEWGRPSNLDGDLLQQDKELALALANGAAQWWFDVGGNKYNHPRLMNHISNLLKAADKAGGLDRSSVDEIALVVDERSLTYLRVGDPLGKWLLMDQLPALQRIGAPVGHYLASDLPKLPARHKVFVFPTSFSPSAEDRRAVEKLKRDGHVLVFLGLPGIYNNGRLDEAAMRDFTGINLRLSNEPSLLRVTLKDGHPLTLGLTETQYGMEHKTMPIAYADDAGATVLGTLSDGRAGFVVKQHPGWTAVYSSAPKLSTAILRRIAELGNVHCYTSPGDVIWATRDLLAISVNRPGIRTIDLPRSATVTDLYQDAQIGQNLRSFKTDFQDRTTRLFKLK